jgi:Tfp pilus assembly protein PilO
MALLPAEPRSQKALLGIIAAVAIAAVFYLYLYSPARDRIEEDEARVEELEFLNEQANARIGNLDAVRRELADTQLELQALERLVPSEAEMPAIYQAIASEAELLGLKLISVTPSPPVADTAGYFQRQDWQMAVEGEYHRIGVFLSRVASFERIVRPQVDDITPAGRTSSGRQLVTAVLSLQTFLVSPGRPDGSGGEADPGASKG